METKNGTIEGSVTVNGDLTILGTVTGSITVAAGGRLYLRGACANNLIVQVNGYAFVSGTVGNDVHNAGSIEMEGTVNGSVLSIGGAFKKSNGAFVRGAFAV